jgi:hypothetical protein
VVSLHDRQPIDYKTSALRNAPVGLATFFAIIPIWGWAIPILIGPPLLLIEVGLMLREEHGHRIGDALADTEVIADGENILVTVTRGLRARWRLWRAASLKTVAGALNRKRDCPDGSGQSPDSFAEWMTVLDSAGGFDRRAAVEFHALDDTIGGHVRRAAARDLDGVVARGAVEHFASAERT